MYDCEYLSLPEMVKLLGISRAKVVKLCNEHPYGFPSIKVGNRYRADKALLEAWRQDWYSGKFDLTI